HGWRGVNIDPCPGSMKLFNKLRNEDINLEVGIGQKKGRANYFFFGENSTRNSFSRETLEKQNLLDHVKNKFPVEITTLEDIFSKYCKPSTVIDFISIDVEGYEYEVI